jgi:predicted HNH restriction endonuclease
LDSSEYSAFWARVHARRERIVDKTSNLLLDKQFGKCIYCESSIEENELINIHHLYELKACRSKADIVESNKIKNLVVLHKECHKVLHSKKADPIKKDSLLLEFK